MMKKFGFVLVVALCALGATLFAGCDLNWLPINLDIKGVEIMVGEATGAVTVSRGDRFDATAKVDINNVASYDVTWAFVGDDLGCQVFIDAATKRGKTANVSVGDVEGVVTLRATVTSKNTVTADLVIHIAERTVCPEDGDIEINAGIYNDYMPGIIEGPDVMPKSLCYIAIKCGVPEIESVSARIVTETKSLTREFSTEGAINLLMLPPRYISQWHSNENFRLDDEEEYTMYVTITIDGKEQLFTLTGTVGVTN